VFLKKAREGNMIPKQWYVVMDSTQVRNKPVGVVRMGEKLVFWRDSSGKGSDPGKGIYDRDYVAVSMQRRT